MEVGKSFRDLTVAYANWDYINRALRLLLCCIQREGEFFMKITMSIHTSCAYEYNDNIRIPNCFLDFKLPVVARDEVLLVDPWGKSVKAQQIINVQREVSIFFRMSKKCAQWCVIGHFQ